MFLTPLILICQGREPTAVLLRLFGDLSVGPHHYYRYLDIIIFLEK